MSSLIQAESHQSRNLKIQALTDISINSCNPVLKCYETACFSSENTKLWHEVNWWKGPAGMTGCQEEQIIIPFEKDVLKRVQIGATKHDLLSQNHFIFSGNLLGNMVVALVDLEKLEIWRQMVLFRSASVVRYFIPWYKRTHLII